MCRFAWWLSFLLVIFIRKLCIFRTGLASLWPSYHCKKFIGFRWSGIFGLREFGYHNVGSEEDPVSRMEAAQAALEAKAKEKVILIHDLQPRGFGDFNDIDFGSATSFGELARAMGRQLLYLRIVIVMCLFDVYLRHRNVFVAPLVGDNYPCVVCGILWWFDALFGAGATDLWVLREACCRDQQSERWDTLTLTKASIRSEGCFNTGLVVHWQLMINCTIGLQVHILDSWWAVTEL